MDARQRAATLQRLAAAYDRGAGGAPAADAEALLRDLAVETLADWCGAGLVGPHGAALLAFADGRAASRAPAQPPPLDGDHHREAEALVAALAATLAGLWRRLAAGELDLGAWRDLVGGALAAGLRSAYTVGAGHPPTGDDQRLLVAELAAQRDYLDGFAADLAHALAAALSPLDPAWAVVAERPTPAGAVAAAITAATHTAVGLLTQALAGLTPKLSARLAQYANAARAAYYRGAVARAAGGPWRVWWELGAAQHCVGCSDYAAGSPYTPDSLPAVPGDGSTPCRGNCKCSLRFERVPPAEEGAG